MSTHYQRGQSDSAAFMLSCPGRHELAAGHPAAKATGTNLKGLLRKLSVLLEQEDLVPEAITIGNAWAEVEYEDLTGRSQATDAEILQPENITRLRAEYLHVTDFIVCCGEKSRLASEALEQSAHLPHRPHLLFIEHLGNRGLSSIKHDVDGRPILSAKDQIAAGRKDTKRRIQAENTERRLEVVARSLVHQLAVARAAVAKREGLSKA